MRITKPLLAFISAALFHAAAASAGPTAATPQVTQLKQVQVGEGGSIQLLFDSKVAPSQIKTEFVNDIVQLSIQDVAVYPAKIISASAPDFTKIFAYQYTPKLIRCRVSVKGKAEAYQSKVRVKASGKLITIAFGAAGAPSSDLIATGSAQALRVSTPPAAEKAADAPQAQASAPAKLSADEKKILDRIESNESKPIHLGQGATRKTSAPSPMRAILSLAAVLALIIGGAALFKKYGQNSALLSKMKRNGKLIEVVATQSLGPKRSIAVVKVAGRVLVLGVASESISLISELDSEDGATHPQSGASFFANLLDAEVKPGTTAAPNAANMNRAAAAIAASTQVAPAIARTAAPAAAQPVVAAQATQSAVNNGIRDRIRNRMEGMKEL